MALDLDSDVDVRWLVGRLCDEAKVCQPELPLGETEVWAATYAVDEGLIVTDEKGNKFRLRVTAEKL